MDGGERRRGEERRGREERLQSLVFCLFIRKAGLVQGLRQKRKAVSNIILSIPCSI
jgi:hypothetical protein